MTDGEKALRRSKPRPQWDDTKEGPGIGPWIVGTLAFGVCVVVVWGMLG
jgi:hypothetical protein